MHATVCERPPAGVAVPFQTPVVAFRPFHSRVVFVRERIASSNGRKSGNHMNARSNGVRRELRRDLISYC